MPRLTVLSGPSGVGKGTVVAVKDLVDVAGFPALSEYGPILKDAVYRRLGVHSQAELLARLLPGRRVTGPDRGQGGSRP